MTLPLVAVGILGLRYPFQSLLDQSSSNSDSFQILHPWSTSAIATFSGDAAPHTRILKTREDDAPSEGTSDYPVSVNIWSMCRLSFLGMIGPCDATLLYYCFPALCYVALYSFLPHKVRSSWNRSYPLVAQFFSSDVSYSVSNLWLPSCHNY